MHKNQLNQSTFIPQLLEIGERLWNQVDQNGKDLLKYSDSTWRGTAAKKVKGYSIPQNRSFLFRDNWLYCIKSKGDSFKAKLNLKLIYSHISPSESEVSKAGFKYILRLFRNERFTELYLESEEHVAVWMSLLQQHAVFTDIHEKYSSAGQLGKGSFGSVHLIVRKNDQMKFAAKVYKKNRFESYPKLSKMIVDEISILRECSHPSIIKLCEVQETDNSIYLIMEYFEGETLMDLNSKTPYDFQKRVTAALRICSGLSYLHSKDIVHRDIKPDNILINDSNQVRIIDFGLSRSSTQNLGRLIKVGTPGFVAPELLKSRRDMIPTLEENKYADIYSFGIVYYCMITGTNPFDDSSYDEIIAKNKLNEINLKSHHLIDASIPEELSFLSYILTSAPQDRLRFSDLVQIFETLSGEKDIAWIGEDFSTFDDDEAVASKNKYIRLVEQGSFKPFVNKKGTDSGSCATNQRKFSEKNSSS